MEKNNKLLTARDVIAGYLADFELSPDECREVLDMCKKEVDAAEKRAAFGEVRKDEE